MRESSFVNKLSRAASIYGIFLLVCVAGLNVDETHAVGANSYDFTDAGAVLGAELLLPKSLKVAHLLQQPVLRSGLLHILKLDGQILIRNLCHTLNWPIATGN